MKNIKNLIIFLIIALGTSNGNAKNTSRSLLFKCIGDYQSHSDIGDEKPLKMAKNLYIGENYAEINGAEYKICEDRKTIVNFSNDCNKSNKSREFYYFFMANHHLSGKNFRYSDDQTSIWFSFEGDCEPVENKNLK